MILGDTCTRNCSFCSVHPGRPSPPDPDEPLRVAQAAQQMGLKYVVITSVTRDDLRDGGAHHFAHTVRMVKHHIAGVRVEVLTPDFKGCIESMKIVLDSSPDVFNHNLETVPRLYPDVRPQADYRRSLFVLEAAADHSEKVLTKSGLMVGLGETLSEVVKVMEDLRKASCQMLTIGQYLRPRKKNISVREYIHPDVFERYREKALGLGFRFVASAPLVRSSMNAEELFEGNKQ